MAKVNLTAGRIASFRCPTDKAQAFLWDSVAPGLGVRTTPLGEPAFIFQSVFQGKTLRITIGRTDARSISDARVKARELQALVDDGRDPREVRKERTAADVAKRESARQEGVTVQEAWDEYIKDRQGRWSQRHLKDHIDKAKPGGETAEKGTRGRGTTVAGPLYPLMDKRLKDIDAAAIEEWSQREAALRPTAGRLAWRLLKTFLGWCLEHPKYQALLPPTNPATTRKCREAFGAPKAKRDVLLREQLRAWFQAVNGLSNQVVAASLQAMLLTGARPGEILALTWKNVDMKWKRLTLRETVENLEGREIPLTPYVEKLLDRLPRHDENEWVFASKKGAPIASPNHQLSAAATAAGIPGLTLHGLRRSFKSLSEYVEVPAGVTAQIMGHKPSAIAEKHYTVRSIDLLRTYHERIEAWILTQAGVALPIGERQSAEKATEGTNQISEADAESTTV